MSEALIANEAQSDSIGLSSKNAFWGQQLTRLGSVARTNHSVLLLGPSGSGKEIISQALHRNSLRRMGAFVSVNCSALSETLIESELFGHIKGSFTGAVENRKGAFEAARGGTLFLDEIGDLPFPLQAKLLRALENNEIRPVGADRVVKTDVRIISATHQNLLNKIKSGEFRHDLYFRLNVITIKTPRLMDRPEDFEEILMSFCKTLKVCLSYDAIQQLKKYSWPGNIRELKNIVTRISAYYPNCRVSQEQIQNILDENDCITNEFTNTGAERNLPPLKEIERQMIIQGLVNHGGNQRRVSSALGMPKSTLHDRLRYYNINPRDYQKLTP